VADVGEALSSLRAAGFRLLASVAEGGGDYSAADWSGDVALLLGNEASGLDPGVVVAADELVTIPMAPAVESLNVSMAATVLCFEVARQRSNLHKMQDDGDRTAAPAVDRT
jgi:tRNA G18 (ribose-2'-O)-methylase SpoU